MARRARTPDILARNVFGKAFKFALRVIDNGHVIEKLRHHRHPRGPRRYMPAKEAP